MENSECRQQIRGPHDKSENNKEVRFHLLREGNPQWSAVYGDCDHSDDQRPIFRPFLAEGALVALPRNAVYDKSKFPWGIRPIESVA